MSFFEQLLLEDVDDLVFLDDIWSRSERYIRKQDHAAGRGLFFFQTVGHLEAAIF